jgi:hypothetical protein
MTRESLLDNSERKFISRHLKNVQNPDIRENSLQMMLLVGETGIFSKARGHHTSKDHGQLATMGTKLTDGKMLIEVI